MSECACRSDSWPDAAQAMLGCATPQDQIPAFNSEVIRSAGQKLVRCGAASAVIVVVVQHDHAPGRHPVCHRFQAEPDRIVPVAVDVREGDGFDRVSGPAVLEQPLNQ